MPFSPAAAVQYALPQRLLCRLIYRLSRSEQRWLRSLLIGVFMRLYTIDLGEAEVERAADYPSFNEFFTRRLKPAARPLEGDEQTIASPVDGRLTEFGRLSADRLLQAKGMSYTLQSLLREPPELLEPFHGGHFMTVYLAPHNYHRVHTPLAGQLDRGRYIPGKRFSVNQKTVAAIDGLFSRNERVALWLSTTGGYCAVVMIGALNVASLTTSLTGEIAPGPERLLSPETPKRLARGDELGRFNLGSTIVMLFPRGAISWNEALRPGQAVRLGQALGRCEPR